jgi:hypothetical protein
LGGQQFLPYIQTAINSLPRYRTPSKNKRRLSLDPAPSHGESRQPLALDRTGFRGWRGADGLAAHLSASARSQREGNGRCECGSICKRRRRSRAANGILDDWPLPLAAAPSSARDRCRTKMIVAHARKLRHSCSRQQAPSYQLRSPASQPPAWQQQRVPHREDNLHRLTPESAPPSRTSSRSQPTRSLLAVALGWLQRPGLRGDRAEGTIQGMKVAPSAPPSGGVAAWSRSVRAASR